MGLADTAELIVALKLRDQLSGGLRGVNRELTGMDRSMGTLNTRVSRTGQVINTALGVGLERVVTGGIAAFVGGIRSGVAEMQALDDAQAQTRAALASTNSVAGQTAAGIRAMSEAFESQNALIDDKVIQAGANVLLTFTNIRKKGFEPTLEAALDLSVRFKQDLQTSIVQIGKAMNDPIRNLGALQRAGIQFTDQQRAQIKTLVESNRLYEAQAIILAELQTQVGGSFAEQGKTDASQAAALKDRMEDLQRILATGLAPGLTRVRTALIEAFDNPQVIAGVRAVGENIANFLSAENLRTAGGLVKDVFGFLGSVPWGTIGDGLQITGRATKTVVDAFLALPKDVQGILIAGLAVNKLSGGIIPQLAVGGLKGLISGLRTIHAAHVTVIGGAGGGLPVDPTKTKGPGNLLGGAWKLLPPLAAAALAAEFSDEITGFGVGLRTDLAKTLKIDLPTWGPDDLDWPFGTRNTPRLPGPDWFADILGGTPPTTPPRVPGTGSFSAPGTRGMTHGKLVLPGTALAPVVSELVRNRTETSTRLLALSGNYAGTNARLDRSNASLAIIAAKNPTINLTNNNIIRLSPTVIQQRIVQQNVISGVTSNDNSAGI